MAASAAADMSAAPPAGPAAVSAPRASPGHAGGHARGELRVVVTAPILVARARGDVAREMFAAMLTPTDVGSPTTSVRMPQVRDAPQREA